MKKIILTIMCFIIIVSLVIVPVTASARGRFSSSKFNVEKGDTFDITVSVGDAKGVERIGIIPLFDKNVFEFVSGEWLIHGVLSEADISKNGAAIIAFGDNNNIDGDIYLFTLKVKDTAQNGSYKIGGTVDTGDVISVTSTNIIIGGTGTVVFGKVTSYNPMNETVIELCSNGVAVYSTTINSVVGSGTVTQDFELIDVSPGEYDLIITKDGHLEYVISNITVGAEYIDLTQHTNEMISDITLIAGDVNSDGCVDLKDVTLLTSSATYSLTPDTAATKSADVNGDNCFDLKDLTIITSVNNYGKAKIEVEY